MKWVRDDDASECQEYFAFADVFSTWRKHHIQNLSIDIRFYVYDDLSIYIYTVFLVIVAYVQVSLKQILNNPQRFRCNFEAMSLRYVCLVSVVASLAPWILTDVMSIKRRETTKVKLQIKRQFQILFQYFGGV